MNTIHSALSPNQFVLISTIDQAKKAWDALVTHYEGTWSAKVSKLHMLITQYDESLWMEKIETIFEFSA